jgi:hypothetical protein
MEGGMSQESRTPDPEPRWPALVAVIASVGLYTALPPQIAVGPRWLQPLVIAGLVIPALIAHRHGSHRMNTILGYLADGAMTVFMVWSLVLLVTALPAHKEKPVLMLRSAVALWITNVLVFALWYWRIFAGGPHVRHNSSPDNTSAFLFPQMILPDDWPDEAVRTWSPVFIDYLYLSFNTSTAFSPTDTPVLTRWAKVLTMVQASISLTVVAVLAARAVNIL